MPTDFWLYIEPLKTHWNCDHMESTRHLMNISYKQVHQASTTDTHSSNWPDLYLYILLLFNC